MSESFYAWFRHSWKRWVPASASFTLPPASWFAQAQLDLQWQWLFPATLILQVFVILIIVGLISRPRPYQGCPRANIAATQFHNCWKTTWILWLFLFIALAVEAGLEAQNPEGILVTGVGGQLFSAALNTLNNSVSLAIFMCYVVLADRTVVGHGDDAHETELPWHLGIGIVAVLAALEAAIVFTPWGDFLPLFGWLSGFGAGLATAVVVGRLDSKYFGIPHTVIIFLYLYAVIQPGWAQFESSPNNAVPLALLNLALALKVLFFMVIKWSIDTGRFHYYADRMGSLIDEIEAERQGFLDKYSRPLSSVERKPAAKKKTRSRKR